MSHAPLRLKEAGLASLAKKVNALLKRAIDHLQSGIMQCLEEALQLEDLELLNELRPWISRGRLAQRSDAVPLLLQIGQFVAAYNALSDAMEKGTGDAFRMALWRSEEAGLQPERCEMLRRAEAQYGPIRRQKEALWAALAARISGNIGLLEAVLPMANAAGINTIGLEDALETRTKSCQDMLEKIAKLTRAARREDIQQLQAAILSLDPDAKTSRRYSLDKLQEEVRDQANQTLFDAKQKAKVQKEISLASKKRSTQVLQEMPKAMMKAEKLRMSTDLRQASSTLKRAQIEKEIRTAISLSDAHTLRAAVAKAESSSIEGLQDVIDQGRAALHEMTLLDNTRELVKGASTVEQLETGLDELIQENFPNGLQPQSSLRQVQAHILAMKQKLSELQQIMASPISFENNNTLLQESGMKQMRLVLDILRVHQYFAITIEHGLAHLAGERAKAVHDLLSKGCRNPLSKKQINEKNKQVKLACQMEKATPELKAALLKMLIKVQSSETNDLQARKSIKPKSQELKKSVSFHSSLEESSV
ncbi:unnamed protein product [Effrenium voratum]|nr:unnamed protein product [Effrenium voratum]